jgi:5-methylcytosine-specific restriction enzyme B
MAKAPAGSSYPLTPLLAQYRRAVGTAGESRSVSPFGEDWLDGATDAVLAADLRRFAESVLPVSYHPEVFTRQVRFLRHALAHLVRGRDPLPERLARCITPGEPYHVAGLGPGFWSAAVRDLQPETGPLWCPATESGLRALALLPDSTRGYAGRFAAVLDGFARVREAAPDLTPDQVTDFLELISRMRGRELPSAPATAGASAWGADPEEIRRAVREVRTRVPLRKRLRESPPDVIAAITRFQGQAAAGEYESAFEAFHTAFSDPAWEAAVPRVDDAYSPALPVADRALLWCEVAGVLREVFRVHPLELADVVSVVGETAPESEHTGRVFRGFCSDTFVFLSELATTNTREWMAANRARYRFVLREPLVELCAAVADRYVRPVLNREYGWDLECDARAGRALTSICKNDFGRTGPYQPVQWITFYRKSRSNKRADAQFFVRVAAGGVRYGFHLGRSAREAGGQFRKAIQEHGEAIYRALGPGTLLGECRFWAGDDLASEVPVKSAADLRAWAANKTIAAGVERDPADVSLRRDDLPGEVLLTFDRLLPLFACAAAPDPRPLLLRRAGDPASAPPYDPAAFHQETFLSEVWLDRVFGLLRLKKQLVLQGVPGTGKTHVARCLARLLTHDRPACARLIQFHPAYSYEEFVEGIRVRNVEIGGHNEVTYPVEDGVLCAFAEQAAARPGEPHVLMVDELNRGNLPRIFGELLFLLEYRDQAVTLPYSKRPFRLPDNLFLLATMNQLDRSAVALDQALRRRFSFVDMPADAAVLASWLEQHPPEVAGDETFGPRVVRLFEELNRRLARDLGPEKQVGQSFFMVPDLNAEKLAAVWDHHVRPLLLDYLGGREERLKDYTPERLLGERPRRSKPAGDAANA